MRHDLIDGLIQRNALFVINHSGGKDSQAMMIRLLRIVPKRQIIVVHASLGEIEWDGALELAQANAVQAGVPFIVARAQWKDGSEKTFLGMVEKRFQDRPEVPSWPSADCRQCTSDLKRDPIAREVRRYANEHGYSLIVNCEGLRAQESDDRAAKPVWSERARECNGKRTWWDWFPIHGMTTDEVFALIAEAGQKPHWAYARGNERLSCVFCIMGKPSDLANGARHRSDLLAKYVEMERVTGYTMHQSRKPLLELVAHGEKALDRLNAEELAR